MKKLIRNYNAFMLRLDICAHILFHTKHERVLQYLDNRLDLRNEDHFYKSDEYLLHTLQKKDQEYKWKAALNE